MERRHAQAVGQASAQGLSATEAGGGPPHPGTMPRKAQEAERTVPVQPTMKEQVMYDDI